jgi:Flp pilus assembly pilin Flp
MRSRMYSIAWQRFSTAVGRRAAAEDGQALIEYALILALVALATIGVLQVLGTNVADLLTRVSTGLSTVSNP